MNKLLLLHATIHAKLHTPLLTIGNFAQQIITSMKFSFEFLYSFGPTDARKIDAKYYRTFRQFVILMKCTASIQQRSV